MTFKLNEKIFKIEIEIELSTNFRFLQSRIQSILESNDQAMFSNLKTSVRTETWFMIQRSTRIIDLSAMSPGTKVLMRMIDSTSTKSTLNETSLLTRAEMEFQGTFLKAMQMLGSKSFQGIVKFAVLFRFWWKSDKVNFTWWPKNLNIISYKFKIKMMSFRRIFINLPIFIGVLKSMEKLSAIITHRNYQRITI